jgi:hypothetical protein
MKCEVSVACENNSSPDNLRASKRAVLQNTLKLEQMKSHLASGILGFCDGMAVEDFGNSTFEKRVFIRRGFASY